MPVVLEVPNTAHSEINVPLGGELFNIIYSFNDRDNRWRIDLVKDGTPVLSGLKIVENVFLLSSYNVASSIDGDIACIRRQETAEGVGRDNLGVGKPYELVYFTQAELDALT